MLACDQVPRDLKTCQKDQKLAKTYNDYFVVLIMGLQLNPLHARYF